MAEEYRVRVGRECMPDTFLEADTPIEAMHIRDQVAHGELMDNAKSVNIEINCGIHGWSSATYGACNTCEDEARDAELDAEEEAKEAQFEEWALKAGGIKFVFGEFISND